MTVANIVSLYVIDPVLAFEDFYKLSSTDQVKIIAALCKESVLNPSSDAAQLYHTLIKL